jgi:GNAT superfamily N-acetyltransferase
MSNSPLLGLVKLRAAQPGDRSYVLKTWVSGYNHSPIARALGNCYYRAWAPIIERQYSRSDIRIACVPDEPGAIIGFAVVQPKLKLLHYVAIREKWRRKGVASLLLSAELECADIKYSHTPPPHIVVPAGWVYAPMTGAGLEEAA